jgi:hypothetical protein
MTDTETTAHAIACCKICLLAEAMKECATCPFNAGLTAQILEKKPDLLVDLVEAK